MELEPFKVIVCLRLSTSFAAQLVPARLAFLPWHVYLGASVLRSLSIVGARSTWAAR